LLVEDSSLSPQVPDNELLSFFLFSEGNILKQCRSTRVASRHHSSMMSRCWIRSIPMKMINLEAKRCPRCISNSIFNGRLTLLQMVRQNATEVSKVLLPAPRLAWREDCHVTKTK
jgi:hypothetical protein